LFVIYINDVDDYVGDRISMCADNTKIGWVVNSEVECLGLQEDTACTVAVKPCAGLTHLHSHRLCSLMNLLLHTHMHTNKDILPKTGNLVGGLTEEYNKMT